jgi:hypothetical protein
MSPLAMGETDITFRHLLRGLPWPILRLAVCRVGGYSRW